MASDLPITLISTLIAYYKAHTTFNTADRFAQRVAVREHYGDEKWSRGLPGLTLRLDGGPSTPYLYEQRGRVEVRIYAGDLITCDVLFALLERDVQDFHKTVVNNEAVLQMLLLESSASYIHDPDTNLPMYIFFMNASVRTTSVLEA